MRLATLASVMTVPVFLVSDAAGGGAGNGFICREPPPPMVWSYDHASLVLVGTFSDSRGRAAFGWERADIEIKTVIKGHAIIGDAKRITVRLSADGKPDGTFLIFCDIDKEGTHLSRTEKTAETSEVLPYLTGAIKRKERPLAERLAYCFPFVRCKETAVSEDAFREFHSVEAADCREMARKLDRKRLVKLLENEDTPSHHLGLYAALLGYCGTAPDDAKVLRQLIGNYERHRGSYLDRMLFGYVLLQPVEGSDYVEKGCIMNSKASFQDRFGALRAIRLLWAQRPEVVGKETLIRMVREAAECDDLADLAINDLRKWRRWAATEQVLELARRKSHQQGIVQTAVLRFALESPMKEAAAYVAEQRKRDPERVHDIEEIFKLDPDYGYWK